jgi:hypothetical protein
VGEGPGSGNATASPPATTSTGLPSDLPATTATQAPSTGATTSLPASKEVRERPAANPDPALGVEPSDAPATAPAGSGPESALPAAGSVRSPRDGTMLPVAALLAAVVVALTLRRRPET